MAHRTLSKAELRGPHSPSVLQALRLELRRPLSSYPQTCSRRGHQQNSAGRAASSGPPPRRRRSQATGQRLRRRQQQRPWHGDNGVGGPGRVGRGAGRETPTPAPPSHRHTEGYQGEGIQRGQLHYLGPHQSRKPGTGAKWWWAASSSSPPSSSSSPWSYGDTS